MNKYGTVIALVTFGVIAAGSVVGMTAQQPRAAAQTANAPFLQAQGHKLLGQNMVRFGRWYDWLDIAARPQVDHCRGPQ